MSTAIYWDTSALLKLYAPVPDSEHFRSLDGIHLGAILAAGIQKITTTRWFTSSILFAKPLRNAELTTALNGKSKVRAFCRKIPARSSSMVKVIRMIDIVILMIFDAKTSKHIDFGLTHIKNRCIGLKPI